MLGAMKKIFAAVLALGFMSSAALACPHEGAENKTVKKDEKAQPPKQADAKAPAPKAAPVKPAPAPSKQPATPAPKAGSEAGKVSRN